MSFKINIRQIDNITILDLSGRITLGEASGTLRDTIRDLVAEEQTNLLLNLGEVSYIDSSGLGELVGAFATVANRGGRLKLLNPQKKVSDLIQITKLISVFETFSSEAEALRSFKQAASAS